jgi:diadenosine tetraphosphatase ApaH/serine/threonine PP2A family protein phosphatase
MTQTPQAHIVRYFLKRFSPLLGLYMEEVHWVGKRIPIPRFTADHISRLLDAVEPALVTDCCAVMDFVGPAWVIGDLHGNFHDLLRVLITTGAVPECRIIFLGDYVDRGSYSLEVILLLFTLKAAYPGLYCFLRGNHEFAKVNEQYGFKEECDARYPDTDIWIRVNQLFSFLPLACVLNDATICLHGGIGPDCQCLARLRAIDVPIDDPSPPEGIVSQIVWSDPGDINGFTESARGCGFTFGDVQLLEFLKRSKCRKFLRAHECVMHGLQSFGNKSGLTVFSTSNYSKRKNASGFVFVTAESHLKAYQNPPMLDVVERQEALYEAVVALEEEVPPSLLTPHLAASEPGLKLSSYPMTKLARPKIAARGSAVWTTSRLADPNPSRRMSLKQIRGPNPSLSSALSLPCFPKLEVADTA